MVSGAHSGATGGEQDPAAPARRRRRFGPRRPDDKGATLVEFAIIAPLLFMLLFGIFEFGFIFGQHLDVRHGAREGARLAVVNFNPDDQDGAAQTATLVEAICDRMDMAEGAEITLSLEGDDEDYVNVQVSAEANQVTGFFSPILDSVDLNSGVEMRIELEPTYAMTGGNCA